MNEIRVFPKLRDKLKKRIFPPRHRHQFADARTCRRTSALIRERKEDQILRTEIPAGGNTGGEWMSAAQGDEPDSGVVAIAGSGGSACTRTSVRCCEASAAALLIADRSSPTETVWQQE